MHNTTNKKQEILEYRVDKYEIDESTGQSLLKHDIKNDLHNSVQVLSEQLYSKDVHFVFELIQNAEDNHYAQGVSPKLHFELMDDDPTNTQGAKGCLAIYNNELGFELKNVKAVSSVGGSTKKSNKDSGYIGEKGIGFKSVFSVTPSPHIYSNGFQFSFRDIDEKTGLGYIIPYWEDDIPGVVQDRLATYNTCILLPLRDDAERDCLSKIRKELNNLDASLLLFLNKISELTIHLDGSTRRYAKEDHDGYTSLINESEIEQSRVDYIVRKRTVNVPHELKESKRENVTKRELCLAFPKSLSGYSQPRYKVFSYLPTEVLSGLPFLVNADFLLPASRESILVDKKWNYWICEQVAKFAADSLCELIQEHPMREAFCWIPIKENCSLDFLQPIFNQVVSDLRQLNFIPTTDGTIVTPQRAMIAPRQLTELLAGIECEERHDGLRFVTEEALEFKKPLTPLLGTPESKAENLADFLQAAETSLAMLPMSWFMRLYSWLSEPSNSWACKEAFKNVPLIPCEGGQLFVANDNVFQNTNIRINYPELIVDDGKADFALLAPELQTLLAQEPMTREFIKAFFGIKPLSQDEYLFKVALPFCAEHLSELGQENLWELNQFVVQNWEALKKENLRSLAYKLPLKTRSGAFVINTLNAQQVVTPPSYERGAEWKDIYTEDEQSDFIVLSDDYLHLLKQYVKRSASEVFSVLGASSAPLKYLAIKTQSIWSINEDAFSKVYRSYLGEQFRNMSSGPSYPNKEGYLAVAPSCLWKPELFESINFRSIFYRWVTQAIKLELDRVSPYKKKKSWKTEPIKHFYGSERHTNVETELWFALKNLAWLPTNNGLKAIEEVFAATEENTRTYGDALNFVDDEVPKELVELLGVPTEVSATSIVETLRFWSKSNLKVDNKKLATIYRRLANQLDDLQARFEKEALIYCPSGEQNWCTSEKAIWSSQSAVLGQSFHWLSEHYGAELKYFWIDSVGIADKPDAKHFAAAWLTLQEEPADSDPREQLEVIYDRLIAYLRKLGDMRQPEWLVEFAEKAHCFSYKNKAYGSSWVSPESIYASDVNKSLRIELEREGAEFIWIPDGKQHSRYELLYQLLGVRYANEALEKKAQFTGELYKAPNKPFLTNATKRLLACLVKSTSDKDWLNSEQLPNVMGSSETLVGHKIDVRFKLDRAVVSAACNVFADDGTVYYVAQDDETLREDIAAELSKMLFKRDFRRHEDTIIRILGVTNERADSFMDKKGWTLSKKEMLALEGMFDISVVDRQSTPEATGTTAINDDIDSEQSELNDSNKSTTKDSNQHVDNGEISPESETVSDVDTTDVVDGVDNSPEDSGDCVTPTTPTLKERSPSPQIKYKKATVSGSATKDRPVDVGSVPKRTDKPARKVLTLSKPSKIRNTSINSPLQSKSGNRNTAPKSNSISKEDSAGYRMLSYVSQEGYKSGDRGESSSEEVMEYANRAEKLVSETLEKEGFKTTLLGGTNPGYDIVAKREGSDESIYVEVKSVLNNWNATGVGLSKTQFELSQREQDNYWLYVVENMTSDEPMMHRIINPAEKIGTYYFDHNWRKLVEKEDKQRAEREKGLELYDLFDGDAEAIFDKISNNVTK